MKETKKTFKIHIVPIIFIGLLTAIDQLTKFMVTSSFELYESRPVIRNILSFTYIQNRGVAWGMFQGKIPVFLILTAIILVLCFFIYSNLEGQDKYKILRANIVILVAGALGNMIDRVKLGFVVDFFEVKFIDFPVFNVADIYVVVSMIMIFILIMFKYSNEEFDEILGIKSKTNILEAQEETSEPEDIVFEENSKECEEEEVEED